MQIPKQALVFLTHVESRRVLAHYERLKRETHGMLDTFLCVHDTAQASGGPRVLPADFRVSSPESESYAPRRHRQMVAVGNVYAFVDMIYMPALTSDRLKAYPYVWIIEYDVDFAGDWSRFFVDAVRTDADYVATTILPREDSRDWVWWEHFRTPPDVTPKQHARSFAPIARFSQRMLSLYRASVAVGPWGGHFESLYPTIALHAGLRVADLGRGKHYTNTPSDPSLSPGTFVFRPPIANEYFHENPQGFASPGMLYHPVKPEPG